MLCHFDRFFALLHLHKEDKPWFEKSIFLTNSYNMNNLEINVGHICYFVQNATLHTLEFLLYCKIMNVKHKWYIRKQIKLLHPVSFGEVSVEVQNQYNMVGSRK